jgi:hypothetical protein
MSVVDNSGRPVFRADQPFSNDPLVAVSKNGARAVIAEFPSPSNESSATYVVRIIDLGSMREVSRQSFTYRPVRLTSQHINQWLSSLKQSPQRGPYFPKDGQERIRKALFRPQFLTAITGLRFLDDGSLLVRERSMDGRYVAAILKPDLTLGLRFTLPDRTSALAVYGKTIYAVQRDDFDVPSVVKLKCS